MLGNGFVADLVDKISAPIPLASWRINSIEHALQAGVGKRTDEIESRLPERANRLKRFLRLRHVTRISPNDAAHFFKAKMFGERRAGWNTQKREESIQFIRGCGKEFAIPFQYFGCFIELIKHGSGVNGGNRMRPECEGSDNPEITAATAKSPEKIGILVLISFNKPTVGQNDISG